MRPPHFVLGPLLTATKSQKERHRALINKLVRMVDGIALSDQQALEELMRMAVTRRSQAAEPMLGPEVVRMMLG